MGRHRWGRDAWKGCREVDPEHGLENTQSGHDQKLHQQMLNEDLNGQQHSCNQKVVPDLNILTPTECHRRLSRLMEGTL